MKAKDYLNNILEHKRQELDQLIAATTRDPHHKLHKILEQSRPITFHFSTSLKGPRLAVMGEVKRRSPSRGEIGTIEQPEMLALEYCRGGASAISVLTDEKNFGGSLADLCQVASTLAQEFPAVSVLRKDFILHPLQLAEAVSIGAHAVLLIVNVVGQDLKSLLQEAMRMGLEVLTEVHDLSDLEIALEAEAPIIGINHRNLSTFEIDLSISDNLRPKIPPHVITVAESGIYDAMQAQRMRDLGYDAILVGEALVRSKERCQLIRQMKGENNES